MNIKKSWIGGIFGWKLIVSQIRVNIRHKQSFRCQFKLSHSHFKLSLSHLRMYYSHLRMYYSHFKNILLTFKNVPLTFKNVPLTFKNKRGLMSYATFLIATKGVINSTLSISPSKAIGRIFLLRIAGIISFSYFCPMNPLRFFLLATLFFGIIIANAQDFKVIKETNDYVLKECDGIFYFTQVFTPSKLYYAYCWNYEDDLREIVVKVIKSNKIFKIKIGSYSLSNLRWLNDNSFAYYRVYWGTYKHKYLGIQYFTVEIKK